MVTEPTIDKSALSILIKNQYGVDITKYTFIPKGEVGFAYRVDTKNNQPYFLKIVSTERQGLSTT